MAKQKSKFNLGYFFTLKNIVPIILIVVIVFFVFNLLQNKSFNPFLEGMENDEKSLKPADTKDVISFLEKKLKSIDKHNHKQDDKKDDEKDKEKDDD